MTVLCFLIIIVFAVYAKVDFSKSFLSYASISILLVTGLYLRYAPPAISVTLVLSTFYVSSALLKNCNKKNKEVFFLKKAFVLMIISSSISTFFSTVDAGFSGWTSILSKIITCLVLK